MADKSYEELFASRLDSEHTLIGHRMSWMMTLNGFLVGGMAVLVSSQDKLGHGATLGVALVLVATVGAISNASCLFSNYWATVAIREAGAALMDTWQDTDAADRDRRTARMRLYGRDPRSFTKTARRHLTWWMHPWILLPITFSALFVAAAFLIRSVSSTDTDIPLWQTMIPVAFLVPMALLQGIEVHRHTACVQSRTRRRLMAQ